MTKLSFVFFFFFFFHFASGQTGVTSIKGTVKEPSGTAVADCYIIICLPGENAMITFVSSDSKGEFTLSFSISCDSIQIKTSRLDYAEASRIIENKSRYIDLVITPSATELKDIVIKPEAVQRRGDTLDFFVQRFVSVQDRSIGDIIRKLPGIEVMADGQIVYQGKAINEFMVENMDLMGGRYGGIVNNLSYQDVATVQILENYEPIHVKKEISDSDRAAINLKLKEGAKNQYLFSIEPGIGVAPFLWDNEASVMQFAVKKQTNIVYKGNNIGKTVENELISFYGNSGYGNRQGFLSIPGSKPPVSNTQRYLNNNVNTLNINRLYAITQYVTISVQGDCLYDEQWQQSVFNTFYITDKDSTMLISEKTLKKDNVGKANFSVIYRNNAPSFFLSNTLKGHGEWTKTYANINSNKKDIGQNLFLQDLSVNNNFSALKIIKMKRLEINSTTWYNRQNEQLSVIKGVEEKDYIQHLCSDLFITRNNVIRGGKNGPFSYELQGGVEYKKAGLKSELSIAGNSGDEPLANNVRINDWCLFAVPLIRFSFNKMMLNIQLPINYNHRNLTYDEIRSTKNFVSLNPSIGLRYTPDNIFRVSFNVERTHSISDINTLHNGYILVNYRTLSKGSVLWAEDTITGARLNLIMNKAERLSNTYLTLSYTHRASNLIVSRDFNDIMQYRLLLPLPSRTGSFNVTMMHTKGFDAFLRKITLTPSYAVSNSLQVQRGKGISNRTATVTIGLTLFLKCWDDSDIRYYGGWLNSRSCNKTKETVIASNRMNTISQTLSFQSKMVKDLYLKIACEYRKIFTSGSVIPATCFIDSDIIYKRKKAEYSVTFSNILNTQDYAIRFLSSFSYSENSYVLRNRSVMLRARFNFNSTLKK